MRLRVESAGPPSSVPYALAASAGAYAFIAPRPLRSLKTQTLSSGQRSKPVKQRALEGTSLWELTLPWRVVLVRERLPYQPGLTDCTVEPYWASAYRHAQYSVLLKTETVLSSQPV